MTYTVMASGLTKSFGDQPVLTGVDLAVESGTVFALLGPNGAGKTTLVRILATLVRADAGTAIVAGHDVRTDPMGVKRAISLTGQYAAIDELLTGRENLEMIAALRHLPRSAAHARVRQLLAEFELTDAADRRAQTYSGGMRRRLDLAISMVQQPQLMFLDEPTTGLDLRSREQLWGTIGRIVEEGVTVLLTTQYLEEADQLADRIALLDRGAVVASGTADELKADLDAETLRLQFADPTGFERALDRLADGRIGVVRTDMRLHMIDIRTDGSSEQVEDLLGRLRDLGVPSAHVSTQRPSLDDVFRARVALEEAVR